VDRRSVRLLFFHFDSFFRRLSSVGSGGQRHRENENLETRRVARQLEQSHDADDAEELEDVVVLLQIVEQEVEIEAERRDKVDDVDRG